LFCTFPVCHHCTGIHRIYRHPHLPPYTPSPTAGEEDREEEEEEEEASTSSSSFVVTTTTTTSTTYDLAHVTNPAITNTSGCWIRNLFEEGIEHQPGPDPAPDGLIPHLDNPITPGCNYKGFIVKTTLIRRDPESESWDVQLRKASYKHPYFHISPHVVKSIRANQVADPTIDSDHQSLITIDDIIIGFTSAQTETNLRLLNTCVVDETLQQTLTAKDPICIRLFFIKPGANPFIKPGTNPSGTSERSTQTHLTRSTGLWHTPTTLYEHFSEDDASHPDFVEHVVLPHTGIKSEAETTTSWTPSLRPPESASSSSSTTQTRVKSELHDQQALAEQIAADMQTGSPAQQIANVQNLHIALKAIKQQQLHPTLPTPLSTTSTTTGIPPKIRRRNHSLSQPV
jgi:hypothetical protein